MNYTFKDFKPFLLVLILILFSGFSLYLCFSGLFGWGNTGKGFRAVASIFNFVVVVYAAIHYYRNYLKD